jgi:hypothetical protein
MKRIWIVLGAVTAIILVHGTYTFRLNHQKAFAQAVEKRIDIVSIHVAAKSGTLILSGHASKPQAEYAEEIARMFIEKYAKRSINPPSDVRNEIEIGSVVTTKTARKAATKAAARAASKGRQFAMGAAQSKSRR